jgi:oligopeptide/dipeptide ABC transporter ATP-binding protein
MTAAPGPLLDVQDLEVSFFTRRGVVPAVRGISFQIERGETVGLVGESGSGKSVTARAILGLIELPGKIVAGSITWKAESLLDPAVQERIRGKELTVVFQNPMTSLHPMLTIGTQITEVLRRHIGLSRRAARERAASLLDLVGIPSPRRRLAQYPSEFSGGMRQRVLIATALACEPELLIADEPTTALDVTIQAQILELLASLKEQLDLAVLLISHDLGVIAGVCDRVDVMYAGRLVEEAPTEELFARPAHPYVVGLLDSTPRLDVVTRRLVSIDGNPPDPLLVGAGCPFAPRCRHESSECHVECPPFVEVASGRKAACWHSFEMSLGSRSR